MSYAALPAAPGKEDASDSADEGCCWRMFCAEQLTEGSLLRPGALGSAASSAPAAHASPPPLSGNRRRLLALIGPALAVNGVWWTYMLATRQLGLFTGSYTGGGNGNDGDGDDYDDDGGGTGTPRWYLTLTMVFGSMAAGATSVGGGAVSFPVMTLAFGLSPLLARDFSLMIQSVVSDFAAQLGSPTCFGTIAMQPHPFMHNSLARSRVCGALDHSRACYSKG